MDRDDTGNIILDAFEQQHTGYPGSFDVSFAEDALRAVNRAQAEIDETRKQAQMNPLSSEKGRVPGLGEQLQRLGQTAAHLIPIVCEQASPGFQHELEEFLG